MNVTPERVLASLGRLPCLVPASISREVGRFVEKWGGVELSSILSLRETLHRSNLTVYVGCCLYAVRVMRGHGPERPNFGPLPSLQFKSISADSQAGVGVGGGLSWLFRVNKETMPVPLSCLFLPVSLLYLTSKSHGCPQISGP